ncbi:MAG TPA: alpha/beta hydrolase [Candidatus Solibacter sp.]|nr:alpha/beta hydrolase [Candidatus Solibacter sp.]
MKTLLLALTFTAVLPAQAPFQAKVAGRGRAMILIPGLGCPGDVWDQTVAHYKDRYEMHVLSLAGFAGRPRVAGPFLEKVREGLAAYIREKKLSRPIIAGHSLGGFVALDFAAHYPDLPGKLVILDSYPLLAGVADPDTTTEAAKKMSAQARAMLEQQPQEQWEMVIKSGMQTRPMVSTDADLQRVIEWSLKSDRSATTDAMVELYAGDLRQDVAKIKAPTLVMGTWIGWKPMGATRESVDSNLRKQYAKLEGVRIEITDTARHFIMWDDPKWMFAQMDSFLEPAKMASGK